MEAAARIPCTLSRRRPARCARSSRRARRCASCRSTTGSACPTRWSPCSSSGCTGRRWGAKGEGGVGDAGRRARSPRTHPSTQASVPFAPAELAYIAALDPAADVALLRAELPALREGCLRTLWASTLALQRCAAASLTLADIGTLASRPLVGDVEEPSELERVCWAARAAAVAARAARGGASRRASGGSTESAASAADAMSVDGPAAASCASPGAIDEGGLMFELEGGGGSGAGAPFTADAARSWTRVLPPPSPASPPALPPRSGLRPAASSPMLVGGASSGESAATRASGGASAGAYVPPHRRTPPTALGLPPVASSVAAGGGGGWGRRPATARERGRSRAAAPTAATCDAPGAGGVFDSLDDDDWAAFLDALEDGLAAGLASGRWRGAGRGGGAGGAPPLGASCPRF